MKTREQIEDLKRQWRNDPCWDLEDAEGFEEHRYELSEYAQLMEHKWTRERLEAKLKRADQLGCSPAMVAYLELIEARIKEQLDS